MQSTSPSPHTWQEVYYAIAAVLALFAAIGSAVWAAFLFIALRKSRAAQQDNTRADTDHTRAETQHLRLETADTAITRFWEIWQKLDDLTEKLDATQYELDNVKIQADKVPAFELLVSQREAEIQSLTLQNKRMKALLVAKGLEIPTDLVAGEK